MTFFATNEIMSRLECLLIFIVVVFSNRVVLGSASDNVTVPVDTLVNLTNNNELWTMLLKDCEEPSMVCVQNNIFRYLKKTLDETNDLQLTSFLKFTKNKLNYGPIARSSDNQTDEFWHEDEFPIESMSRTLHDETRKFLMTHDVELSLPDTFLPNSVLKIAPRGFENNGALVNLEVISQDLEESRGVEQGRLFKKLTKFINEKIIYAVLALLLVIKLLAVKFLFVLPLIVGAATAKKLLFKILLFVFPFLHHLFKFCAYYPIQAKFHHHKHLISHIHKIAPHPHHHDEVEVGPHSNGPEDGPYSYGPPPFDRHGPHDEHHTEYDDDVSVFPDDGGYGHGFQWLSIAKHIGLRLARLLFIGGKKAIHFLLGNPWLVDIIKGFIKKGLRFGFFVAPNIVRMALATLISHRKDPIHENEISSLYGGATRRKPNRPLTSAEIERTLAKAEKEAIIKSRLEKERQRIREENLKLQEELNQAIKLQEKLKYQANYLGKKVPHTKISASSPYNRPGSGPPLKSSPFDPGSGPFGQGPGLDLPAGYIPQHTVPQRPQASQQFPLPNTNKQSYQPISQNHFEDQYQAATVNNNGHQQISQQQTNQKSEGPVYRPEVVSTSNQVVNKVAQVAPSSAQVSVQKSIEVNPRVGVFDNSGEVKNVGGGAGVKYSAQIPAKNSEKPKIEQAIYQAASITFDPFYTPLLQKIDNVLQSLGFIEEPCKERLICSMYKNPTKYSPHSNLVSAELSRDSTELLKPTSTNSAVIRFYKYVQAARDGQDQRDCLRLYPACLINTEVS